ncbi:hypothetical protein NIES25_52370 [Nostoc linckia NIES-25]|nr:hypothetical protein NIES25_52370 [Nostoc linckia NIES-25]
MKINLDLSPAEADILEEFLADNPTSFFIGQWRNKELEQAIAKIKTALTPEPAIAKQSFDDYFNL